MRNIAVCDDDGAVAAHLKAMLLECCGEDCPVRIFSSERSIRTAVAQNYRPEAALMDIRFGSADGIGLARRLFPSGSGTSVIFITGFAEYCTEVYEADHIYFLLKPVSMEKLRLALRKAETSRKPEDCVAVRTDGALRRIARAEIRYVESDGRRIRIHLPSETVEANGALTKNAGLFGPDFLQCHKSFLVNLNWVERLQKEKFILSDGTEVPISQKRWQDARRVFQDFLAARLGPGAGE